MAGETYPNVTIFAVVRSESADQLARMIRSCELQDWPSSIDLVIAAPSEDAVTVDVLLRSWTRGRSEFVVNPLGARSVGLNLAVAASRTELVMRVDARSRLGPDHVRLCAERLLSDPHVGVVGGVQWPQAELGGGSISEGICLALRNPWLLGGAAYRRLGAEGPVDTVYLGAYRRSELLERRFNETLLANEDFDLCQRYRSDNMLVWLEQGLEVPYVPRSTLVEIARQYVAFGRAKTSYWRSSSQRPNTRQVIALGALGLGALAGLTQLRKPGRIFAGAVCIGSIYGVSDAVTVSGKARLRTRLAAVLAHGVIHIAWVWGIIAEASSLSR